ncbi:MAG: VCBS repeat-containing protein, partial [Candidatus Zixiibacteriota bacterium]
MTVKSLDKYVCVIASILFLSVVSGTVDAAEQDFFDIYSLEVEGEIFDFLADDFDGDGLNDIAVIYSPASDLDSRYVGLYLQEVQAGFRANADYLGMLPQTAAQIGAADLDGDGMAEIILVDSDGVSMMDLVASSGLSTPVRIVRQKTIFSFPLFGGIVSDPFLHDINGIPGPEIIIPTPRGYVIFERGDDGVYQILNQLSAPIICRNSDRDLKSFSRQRKVNLNVSLATIRVHDGNLDGRNDLYFLWDRRLCCYFQDSTGNFSEAPDVQLDFYPANADGFIQSRLIDLNGDRRPDATVSYTSGGITSAETKIRFYIADAGGRIGSQFRKEITLSDSHCNLFIDDFNADGSPELAVPAIELGALAATKMFLMKNSDIHLLVYPFENGVPDDEPTQRMKYGFRFNFDDPQPASEVAVDWSADYTGDGLYDLVFSDGKGKLQFFWGNSDEYLSKKSDLEIPL